MRDSTKELIADYENLIPLMKLEDGIAKFECRHYRDPKWVDCILPTMPIWGALNVKFRVKPKPAEVWVWKLSDGSVGEMAYAEKLPEEIISATGRTMILMREVTE